MAKGQIYVATDTFATHVGGEHVIVTKGVTRVREGHELLRNAPDRFEPIDLHVDYDVESATAEPGEKRGEEPKQREEPKPSATGGRTGSGQFEKRG